MIRILRWLWHLAFVRPVAWLLLGLKPRHRERLPRSGPAVVVANHNSHIDILVLSALFPLPRLMRLRPVAAADYVRRNRLFHWLVVRVMGAVCLRRRDFRAGEGDPLAACCAALDRGDILILFPEGTRGEPEKLAALKPGIAHLARRYPDTPVVPVFLHGAGKALPKGRLMPVPLQCDALVGDALRWNGDRDAFMQALSDGFASLEREGRFPEWE